MLMLDDEMVLGSCLLGCEFNLAYLQVRNLSRVVVSSLDRVDVRIWLAKLKVPSTVAVDAEIASKGRMIARSFGKYSVA